MSGRVTGRREAVIWLAATSGIVAVTADLDATVRRAMAPVTMLVWLREAKP